MAALYIATPISADHQPFHPALQVTAISDQAPGANADISFVTSEDDEIVVLWTLDSPPNSWDIAGDSDVPDGGVTAVGTMAVDEGCNGSVETYGPFNLRDQATDGDSAAQWDGDITDEFAWSLSLVVDGSQEEGFSIEGVMTDAVGVDLCAPQTFTITFCGRVNPDPSATVCGSSDPVIMTNPAAADTYAWEGSFTDLSGAFGESSASVCVGASCPTPMPFVPTAAATAAGGDATDEGGSDDETILIGAVIGGAVLALAVVGYGTYRLVRRRRRSGGSVP